MDIVTVSANKQKLWCFNHWANDGGLRVVIDSSQTPFDNFMYMDINSHKPSEIAEVISQQLVARDKHIAYVYSDLDPTNVDDLNSISSFIEAVKAVETSGIVVFFFRQ